MIIYYAHVNNEMKVNEIDSPWVLKPAVAVESTGKSKENTPSTLIKTYGFIDVTCTINVHNRSRVTERHSVSELLEKLPLLHEPVLKAVPCKHKYYDRWARVVRAEPASRTPVRPITVTSKSCPASRASHPPSPSYTANVPSPLTVPKSYTRPVHSFTAPPCQSLASIIDHYNTLFPPDNEVKKTPVVTPRPLVYRGLTPTDIKTPRDQWSKHISMVLTDTSQVRSTSPSANIGPINDNNCLDTTGKTSSYLTATKIKGEPNTDSKDCTSYLGFQPPRDLKPLTLFSEKAKHSSTLTNSLKSSCAFRFFPSFENDRHNLPQVISPMKCAEQISLFNEQMGTHAKKKRCHEKSDESLDDDLNTSNILGAKYGLLHLVKEGRSFKQAINQDRPRLSSPQIILPVTETRTILNESKGRAKNHDTDKLQEDITGPVRKNRSLLAPFTSCESGVQTENKLRLPITAFTGYSLSAGGYKINIPSVLDGGGSKLDTISLPTGIGTNLNNRCGNKEEHNCADYNDQYFELSSHMNESSAKKREVTVCKGRPQSETVQPALFDTSTSSGQKKASKTLQDTLISLSKVRPKKSSKRISDCRNRLPSVQFMNLSELKMVFDQAAKARKLSRALRRHCQPRDTQV